MEVKMIQALLVNFLFLLFLKIWKKNNRATDLKDDL